MNILPKRPITRRDNVVEDFHGTKVADPYRWLEDDTCPDVQEWMSMQNKEFQNYIGQFDVREEFKTRLTDLLDYARSTVPRLVEGVYYWWHNNGLQNQPVLYRSVTAYENGEIVLDPNMLSEDGTVAVTTTAYSPCGRYLAYGLSSKGSDWQRIHLLNLETLEKLPDVLEHLKFTTPCWLPDSSGFFYSCFPAPDTAEVLKTNATNMMVRLHVLGQEQNADRLIHKDGENPDWNFTLTSDEDKNWVFLNVWYGTLRKNKLFYRPLKDLDTPWLPIADNFDDGWDVIGVVNDAVYLETQQDALFSKVVAAKLTDTGISELQTIIPDRGEMLKDYKLGVVAFCGSVCFRFKIVETLRHALSVSTPEFLTV